MNSAMNQNQSVTPYQGKKRCFGEYQCPFCNKTWKSANSKANESQKCTRCGHCVFPTKQTPLENVFDQLRRQREIKLSILENITNKNKA